jgi:lysophospholipase L1-like esterase
LHATCPMPRPTVYRVLILVSAITLFALSAACSKDSPTSPSAPPSQTPVYTAIGASDAVGVGGSVVCAPFQDCPGGTGYVYLLFRRLTEGRTGTLTNVGVPASVMSPRIVELGRRIGRSYPGNFLDNQAAFTNPQSTVVTIFAGGNDANTIIQVIREQQAGTDDFRAFIDTQVRQWGEDYVALVRRVRERAPNARIVAVNLPNLAAAPYAAGGNTFERSMLQRIAVGLSDQANALTAQGVSVVDLMCEPRLYDAANFSADGFHPSDRGYALIAEVTYPAMVNPSHPAPAADCAQRRIFPPL